MKSLRARLVLAYAGLIVVGFTGLALLAGRQISAGANDDYERGLETSAALVARGLEKPLENFAEGGLDMAALETAVTTYANQLNARLTLLDSAGRAWLDSSGVLPTGNQLANPEITTAFERRITRDTRDNEQGEATVYTAAPIIEDNQLLSIVSLSAPASGAQEIVASRWLALGVGVGLLTVAAISASLWLSASLVRPLERLRESALRMAGGDLAQRLPEDRSDEIGQLAAAFNHMASQVQRMIEEQRAFAGNASHELRTPLTTIRLRSEALREGTLDEATAQQYIAEIDDEVVRLSSLVSDLILLSRFEAGRAERGQEQVDPVRLARSLMQHLKPQAESRQVQLTLEPLPPLPPVEASQTHMRAVLQNLLTNALKYTPSGGQVSWKLWSENGYLRAEIRDTGQGIAPEDLPHLFDRFYRGDKARTRQVAGFGLGLSLTQSIIAFYNGRLSITSPGLGQGSTAAVWWPLSPNVRSHTETR